MSDVPPERRSWPRRLLNRLEVDRAVFYSIASRGWQFFAGPITIVLIAWYFSKDVQGYYYTFWSVVGLQMFFELGFPQAITNFASHQWSRLDLADDRRITGDSDSLSRLSSLFRAALLCYLMIAVALALTITIAGWIVFSLDENADRVAWRMPWLALAALSAIGFCIAPAITILEGCNQVRSVYKMHLARAILGNIAVWIAIPMGAALWTPAIATAVRLLCECVLILGSYRLFFKTLLSKPTGPVLHWWRDVWPFQWRIGLRGMFSYFNATIMNPVVFVYQDAATAGQLGMVWQVLSSIGAACGSWVRARVAQLGMLVAKREFAELDRVFFRVGKIAVVIMVLACAAFCCFDWFLYWIDIPLAERFLRPLPTALLAIGLIATLMIEFEGLYIHAHQRAPYLVIAISNALVNGLLIWVMGANFGVLGVAAAYGLMNLFINLPLRHYLWKKFVADYHRDLESEASSTSISPNATGA